MTLEKSSNWWETPGLGELSMAAGSVPLGLGTYVVGTRLLNANPRVAAAAGVAAGAAQAANNIFQARANGTAGLVTPSTPLTDVGKSILTGGMGALGGVGLSSIANLGTPTGKTIATLGALISAADFARRRGKAAIERRAYGNELDRQMEEYYSKEAEVTRYGHKKAQVDWYGHEKLSGSLLASPLDSKPSVVVLPSSTSTLEFLLQKFAAETAAEFKPSAPAPKPPSRRQNRENRRLLAAAERSARNAASSGNFASSVPSRINPATTRATSTSPAPARDPAVLAASAARGAQQLPPASRFRPATRQETAMSTAPTRDPAVLAASAAGKAQQLPPASRFRPATRQEMAMSTAPTKDPAVLAASAAVRRAEAQTQASALVRDPAVLAASAARRAQTPPSNLQNLSIAAAPPSSRPTSRPVAAPQQPRPIVATQQQQQPNPFSSVARMQNSARNAVNAASRIRGFV